jgi:outer membrane protein assembly factor BamB
MWSVTSLISAFVVAAAFTSCSGSGDAPSPDADPAKPVESRALATASVTPQSVVPQARWMLDSIEIANADAIAEIDGALFVKTDDGRVVRVDPETGEITAEAKVDTAKDRAHYCQGIGSDGKTLWACSASDDTTDIVRLDPATLNETARSPVDKVFDQYALPVVDGKVWVLTGDGSRLTIVDATTGEQATVPLPERCFQLAVSSQVAYATCLLADKVIAVDVASGDVIGSAQVIQPTSVSVFDHDVWVSGSAGLVRLDSGLEPQVEFPGISARSVGDIIETASAVWVRTEKEFLLRIDPATGEVAARYEIDPVPSGGSLLVTDDAVWTTAFNDSIVYKIDPNAH